MYHGYHTLLKALGKLVQESMNLAVCRIEMEDQYNILSITEPFLCQWVDCTLELFCPNKFYRHVEKHALDTKAKESAVLPEGDDGPTSNDLKFVCTWGGMFYLVPLNFIILCILFSAYNLFLEFLI